MDEQEKAALGDGGNEHSLAVAEAEKARPLAFWIVTWGCIVLALPLAAALRSWEVLALAALHLAALTVDEFVTKGVAMQRYPRQTAAVVAAAYALACWRWWQSPDAMSLPVHLYKQPHFGAASGFRLGELNAASLVLPWPWLLALAVGLVALIAALDSTRFQGGGVWTAVLLVMIATWALSVLRIACWTLTQPYFGLTTGFGSGVLNAAAGLVLPLPWLLALTVGLPLLSVLLGFRGVRGRGCGVTMLNSAWCAGLALIALRLRYWVGDTVGGALRAVGLLGAANAQDAAASLVEAQAHVQRMSMYMAGAVLVVALIVFLGSKEKADETDLKVADALRPAWHGLDTDTVRQMLRSPRQFLAAELNREPRRGFLGQFSVAVAAGICAFVMYGLPLIALLCTVAYLRCTCSACGSLQGCTSCWRSIGPTWACPARGSCLQELLALPGTDVDEQNFFGHTALMEAAARGRTSVVGALLAAGARTDQRAEVGPHPELGHGVTALDMSKPGWFSGSQEVHDMLKGAGAKTAPELRQHRRAKAAEVESAAKEAACKGRGFASCTEETAKKEAAKAHAAAAKKEAACKERGFESCFADNKAKRVAAAAAAKAAEVKEDWVGSAAAYKDALQCATAAEAAPLRTSYDVAASKVEAQAQKDTMMKAGAVLVVALSVFLWSKKKAYEIAAAEKATRAPGVREPQPAADVALSGHGLGTAAAPVVLSDEGKDPTPLVGLSFTALAEMARDPRVDGLTTKMALGALILQDTVAAGWTLTTTYEHPEGCADPQGYERHIYRRGAPKDVAVVAAEAHAAVATARIAARLLEAGQADLSVAVAAAAAADAALCAGGGEMIERGPDVPLDKLPSPPPGSCSYAELLVARGNKEQVAPANRFVSHAWKMPFSTVVDSLRNAKPTDKERESGVTELFFW